MNDCEVAQLPGMLIITLARAGLSVHTDEEEAEDGYSRVSYFGVC